MTLCIHCLAKRNPRSTIRMCWKRPTSCEECGEAIEPGYYLYNYATHPGRGGYERAPMVKGKEVKCPKCQSENYTMDSRSTPTEQEYQCAECDFEWRVE